MNTSSTVRVTYRYRKYISTTRPAIATPHCSSCCHLRRPVPSRVRRSTTYVSITRVAAMIGRSMITVHLVTYVTLGIEHSGAMISMFRLKAERMLNRSLIMGGHEMRDCAKMASTWK